MKKITVCTPCYKRPKRTLRALSCVMNQDMNDWEAYFIGDNCSDFQQLLDMKIFDSFSEEAKQKGNSLYAWNEKEHYGGWGYEIRNKIIEKADSEYLLFLDNDDEIKENHLSNYYNTIKNTENDFMFFNSFIQPINKVRNTELKFGLVGNCELIIKTSFLKKIKIKSNYGHDWTLIEDMIRSGAKYGKAENKPVTYIVKCLGDFRNDEID